MRYRGTPGTLYRPSNGSEGEQFESLFCAKCARNPENSATDSAVSCSILDRAWLFEKDDPEFPAEWQHNEAGLPCCTAFTRDKPTSQIKPLPGQQELFE